MSFRRVVTSRLPSWSIGASRGRAGRRLSAGTTAFRPLVGRAIILAIAVAGALVPSVPAWAAAPGNDNFAAAESLPLAEVIGSIDRQTVISNGTTEDATRESDEQDNSCAESSDSTGLFAQGPSVWYSVTAPLPGHLFVDVDVPGLSPPELFVAAYSGDTLSSLTEIGCNPADYSTLHDVTFHAPAGTSYWIAVSGSRTIDESAFTLELVFRPEVLVDIASTSREERDAGHKPMKVPVTLSEPASYTVTVTCFTPGDTATPDQSLLAEEDYQLVRPTLEFAPGETKRSVEVPIFGDRTVEPDEVFYVECSSSRGSHLSNYSVEQTILNDD